MTYIKEKRNNSYYTAIFLIAIVVLFLGVRPIQASELSSLGSQENSQSLTLLSPNFAVVIPVATGGPLYDETNKDILVSNIGSMTGEFFKKNIEDTNGVSIYIVKDGDTLSEIAELFDVSINTIKWENNIGNNLRVGQELRILPVSGVMHTVKKGDTFSKIAAKYNVEIEDITIFNNIDSTKLTVGEKIMVPNGVKNSSSPNIGVRIRSSRKIGGAAQHGYYQRPSAGKITSPFGPRHGSYHYGIDFGQYRGAPIVASASGKIVKIVYGCSVGSWDCGGGYGNNIIIQHSNSTKTRYAHLSKIIVKKGDDVVQGQKIGEMGNTGNVRPRPQSYKSTAGTHLHFEIIKSNGQKMNPNSLFK